MIPVDMSRCLGSGALAGEKVVRLAYIDEAGIGNPAHEPIMTVGAVIVHADSLLIPLQDHLRHLVRKHIPEMYWDTFVFHATHMFNWGGPVFTKNNPEWPLSKRLLIADDLADIPRRVGLPLVAGICERSKYGQENPNISRLSANDLNVAVQASIFFRCAINIERWMSEHAPDEICMIILENNDNARKVISAACLYENERKITSLLPEEEWQHYPFRHIKEEPSFQSKRPGSVLQLADFWAYLVKRMHMDPTHAIYRPRLEMLRSQVWDPAMRVLPS